RLIHDDVWSNFTLIQEEHDMPRITLIRGGPQSLHDADWLSAIGISQRPEGHVRVKRDPEGDVPRGWHVIREGMGVPDDEVAIGGCEFTTLALSLVRQNPIFGEPDPCTFPSPAEPKPRVIEALLAKVEVQLAQMMIVVGFVKPDGDIPLRLREVRFIPDDGR